MGGVSRDNDGDDCGSDSSERKDVRDDGVVNRWR